MKHVFNTRPNRRGFGQTFLRKSAALTGTAAVLLLSGAGLSAATNALTNPGFETSNYSGWSTWGGNAVDSTNALYYNGGNPTGSSNVWAHSGAYVGKLWGQYQPYATFSGAYQDVVAGPGSVWSAAGYAISHQLDFVQPGNKFWFEVTFRDSADNVLALFRSATLDPASPEGVTSNLWYSLEVTNLYDPSTYELLGSVPNLGAPAGTSKVRFQATFSQSATYPNGSIYFDDVSLMKLAGSDPDISVGPVGQRKVEGQTVTFTVTATGASTLQYQWQKDGADVANDARISGATTATLRITGLIPADSGSYTVKVTDNAGNVTSGAAVLTVVTPDQASNLLVNRGFETGTAAGWTRFNGSAIVNTTGDLPIYDGTWAGQAYGTGVGSWNGIFQDVPASAGQAFTAEGWFLVSANAPISGSSECWLEVQFMNGTGNMIGLYKSEYVTSNSVASAWVNLKATNTIAFWGDYSVAGHTDYLIAPPGTATVRYQVTYHGGDGGGAVYFDNMNLLLKLPVTAALTRTGSSTRISWPAQIGVSYQVLYKNHLTDPDWQVLTTVTGDLSGSAAITDTVSENQRFYLVKTL